MSPLVPYDATERFLARPCRSASVTSSNEDMGLSSRSKVLLSDGVSKSVRFVTKSVKQNSLDRGGAPELRHAVEARLAHVEKAKAEGERVIALITKHADYLISNPELIPTSDLIQENRCVVSTSPVSLETQPS